MTINGSSPKTPHLRSLVPTKRELEILPLVKANVARAKARSQLPHKLPKLDPADQAAKVQRQTKPASALRRVFAQNIKAQRQALALSQEALAELCDLHRTYVSAIERAKVNVSMDLMDQIARSLRVPLVTLLVTPKRKPKASQAARAASKK